jgi:hypothetical protein
MEIKIQIDPALADVELIGDLVDRLAAGDGDPEALRRDIKRRLRRLVKVEPLDSGA